MNQLMPYRIPELVRRQPVRRQHNARAEKPKQQRRGHKAVYIQLDRTPDACLLPGLRKLV